MTCKVGALLQPGVLTAEDHATLQRELHLVPATAMAKALTLEGHPVGQSTVKDHRAERCACYRKATP